MIKARVFAIILTVFIFLPVGYLLFREGIYRVKHRNETPVMQPVADTLKHDSAYQQH